MRVKLFSNLRSLKLISEVSSLALVSQPSDCMLTTLTLFIEFFSQQLHFFLVGSFDSGLSFLNFLNFLKVNIRKMNITGDSNTLTPTLSERIRDFVFILTNFQRAFYSQQVHKCHQCQPKILQSKYNFYQNLKFRQRWG